MLLSQLMCPMYLLQCLCPVLACPSLLGSLHRLPWGSRSQRVSQARLPWVPQRPLVQGFSSLCVHVLSRASRPVSQGHHVCLVYTQVCIPLLRLQGRCLLFLS